MFGADGESDGSSVSDGSSGGGRTGRPEENHRPAHVAAIGYPGGGDVPARAGRVGAEFCRKQRIAATT